MKGREQHRRYREKRLRVLAAAMTDAQSQPGSSLVITEEKAEKLKMEDILHRLPLKKRKRDEVESSPERIGVSQPQARPVMHRYARYG